MNVVIAGESGIGKSSLVNLITGRQLAKTSNDSSACTLSIKSHRTSIDGHSFILWDTPGFDEGLGRHSANYSALFRSLMNNLESSSGVGLVVYCMLATRAKVALMNNYFAVRALVPKPTPVVAVVTSLERYPDRMEDWWSNNESELTQLGMTFMGHACITALADCVSLSPPIRERIAYSRKALRGLIRRACSSPSFLIFPTSPLPVPTEPDSERPASRDCSKDSTAAGTYLKLPESRPLRRRKTTLFHLPSSMAEILH
ncbi:hypothetical protein J3A83DRAFT_4209881 [Scleroderma citrinum]